MDTRSRRARTRAQIKKLISADSIKKEVRTKRALRRRDNKMNFNLPSTSATSETCSSTMPPRPISLSSVNSDSEPMKWITGFRTMTKAEQLSALDALVCDCEPAQLRHLHGLVEPLLQKDFISLLPREIASHIISFLPATDLMNAGQTCRRWRTLCEDNYLWREKCTEAAITQMEPPNLARKTYWELSDSNMLNNTELNSPEPSGKVVANRVPEPDNQERCYKRTYWKALYMRHNRIRSNWLNNRPTAQCHMLGHDEHVITGLQMSGEIVVTASDDQTVRIWSATSAKVLHTLTGHSGGVWTLLLSDDGTRVISGSTDRTIRVWDTRTGRLVHTLAGHTSTVRCMALNGNRLVTGSRDCSVRVWDIEEGVEVRMLVAHVAAIRCVQFDGTRIVSGSYDTKIAVFNADSGKRLHLLSGHTNRVYSLLLDGERSLVVSGSLDTTIRIWNISEGLCLHTLLGHQSLTSGMQLRGNTLVSANADSTIKVWNIIDGSCTHTLAGPNRHSSAVTCLQFLYGDTIATSSDDGTVKMWDIKNGTFICNLVKLPTERAGGCVWRLKTTPTLLCCAVGSRNGSEDTKLILVDFETRFP